MWYPRVNSSLSSLKSFQAKRKSVANNNICDNSGNGAPDHGRRKLDSLAVIGRSKRGYGGSPNRGLRASPARGGLKCLPAEGGHGHGAGNYGADSCVRVAGGDGRGAPEVVSTAETRKKYNNNNVRVGEGHGRKGRKSDGKCSRDLVMEKVIILKRGQTIQDVAAEPSNDAGVARVCSRDERAEGKGCAKVNWLETPARVWVECDAGSAVGCDLRLGEIGRQDVQKNEEQMSRPREGLGKTSTAWPAPNPSTVSPEGVGILRPVSIGSRGKSWEEEEMPAILPESGGSGCCRGGRSPSGSGDALEKEEESASSSAASSSSSPCPSPVFMLEKWAGPPYCKSPSPRCLPLPKFSMQHKGTSDANAKGSDDFAGLQMENGNCSPPKTLNETLLSLPVLRSCGSLIPQAGVDAFATRGLRRLLHLD